MTMREMRPGIYSVGSQDWDRRLFDELIPLPDGTSYNAYLVIGEKTALIDTVDPTKEHELVATLKSLNVKVDYVISHHAEQDHSGSIPAVLSLYPDALVVTNERCRSMLEDLLHISPERFLVVSEGESISLGGKTLTFFMWPWVHWPETMVTYLAEDRILFSCDLFGSHIATSDLFVTDEPRVYESAKRYYAEIMMPFRLKVRVHLTKTKALSPDLIAPSHGPIHANPKFIIDAYQDWVADDVKNEVILAFVSMHGSTRAMVDYLIGALMKRGITVKPFNLTQTDIGELAMNLVDAATVLIATPTVLAGPHPAAVYAAYLANALRPKVKYLSVIGSYGWGGKTLEILKGMVPNLKVELLEPVIIKGHPREADFTLLDNLADEIERKHRELGLL